MLPPLHVTLEVQHCSEQLVFTHSERVRRYDDVPAKSASQPLLELQRSSAATSSLAYPSHASFTGVWHAAAMHFPHVDVVSPSKRHRVPYPVGGQPRPTSARAVVERRSTGSLTGRGA